MANPFDILRRPILPIAPDPIFAQRLRARLERLMKGTTMDTDLAADATIAARHGDVDYVSLWVPDATKAADFFSAVLGWSFEPGSDRRQVEGLSIRHGFWGGQEHNTLFLCFAVSDVNAAAARVEAAGGTASPPDEQPYGLLSDCVDDQGMRFALHQSLGVVGRSAGPANGARHGDISYLTLEVQDSGRFRRFFGDVLGWRFQPGRVEDGWGVEDVVPMTGLQGGHDRATCVPMYRVDDIIAAVARVRAAGGTATDPSSESYGLMSECQDDQGTRFYLGQH